MRFNKKQVYNAFFLLVIIIYSMFYPLTENIIKADSLFVLWFSLIFVYKARGNIPVMIAALFMLYVNYSIVVGEFFLGNVYGCPLMEVKNIYNYGVAIRCLFVFISTQSLLYVEKKHEYNLSFKTNIAMYIIFYILTVMGMIYGVNRNFNRVVYMVAINPIYEYSKTLFLFLYLYAGGSRRCKNLILPLMLAFVLQDAYYGGRITSIQVLILFLVTFGVKEYNISIKKIIVIGIIGLFATQIMALYRASYSFSGIDTLAVVKKYFSSFLISDTATYSFYASATHIAASQEVESAVRVSSFLEFIATVFVGSGNLIKGNVTRFIADNYYFNLGGGIISTHAFFWFGWFGVISISILVIILVNKFNTQKNTLEWLIGTAIIVNIPRWYLYNPLILFRGSILFIFVVYYISILLPIANKPQIRLPREVSERGVGDVY